MEKAIVILRALRPRQWVKNLAILAPLLFAGRLFDPASQIIALQTVLIFVALSSGIYLINDIRDVKADQAHPYKKFRPIASGRLSVIEALILSVLLIGGGLWQVQSMNEYLQMVAVAYVIMQLGYSFGLKQIPIVDLLIIAIGYLLRIYAGAFAIGAHMDVWFLLTVISASLFLAVGKRKGEMTLMKSKVGNLTTRATLNRYTESLLDVYTAIFATGTWISYSLFTFNHPRIVPDGIALEILSVLPRALVTEKWLMATIPFVVYGLMRYLQLIYERNEGESPERILLSDKPLLLTSVLWVLSAVFVIYYVS
jgi:4-hydroxybenzoate polyprenyltransferase